MGGLEHGLVDRHTGGAPELREQMIREFDKQIRQINRLEGKDYYSTEKADKLREVVKEKRQRLKGRRL